jgi:hypothetical protein
MPPKGEEKPSEPVANRLGDANFNRVATSFNLHKGDVSKANDISRQFGIGTITPDVAASQPISGWAIMAIAAIAAIIAMSIGHYESDREDRKRRKSRRRRHRSAS